MKSNLLTCSNFGKFFPSSNQQYYSIQFGLGKVLQKAKFNLQGDKIYLLDKNGTLLCLSLTDKSVSTLSSQKLHLFQIDSHNSFELYGVTRQSNLLKIAFFNKQVNKITNLNVNRIIDFQKNHFTNTLLLVQFQIILLIDANYQNGVKTRSIKANNGENYIAGRFLGQNRFIAVVYKNNQLRVLQTHKFNAVDRLKLPLTIKNLKLVTSYDGSMLIVYGQSSSILLARISKQGKITYQILKLSMNYVIEIKFTYQNDILILANDGVLYGISPKKSNTITVLFNQYKNIKVNRFDVSFNSKIIAITANSYVHIIQFPSGVKSVIEKEEISSIIQIQAQQQTQNNQIDKKYQYNQDNENQQNNNIPSTFQLNKDLQLPEGLPNFNKLNQKLPIMYEVKQLNVSQAKMRNINEIYHYLHEFSFINKLGNIKTSKIISFIYKLLTIFVDPKKVTLAAYFILYFLTNSIQDNSLQKYALILSPRIIQKINRSLNCEFQDFVVQKLLNLFQDYLNFSNSVQLIMILVNNCHRQSFIPIFIISLLLQLRNNNQSWPIMHKQQINLNLVLSEAENLLTNSKHAYIFAKQQQIKQQQQISSENLQQLLAKQAKIDFELNELKKIKN